MYINNNLRFQVLVQFKSHEANVFLFFKKKMQQYVIQFYRLRLVEGEIEEKAKSNHEHCNDAPDSFEGYTFFIFLHFTPIQKHQNTWSCLRKF